MKRNVMKYQTKIDSPIGTLTLVAEDDALTEVHFPNDAHDDDIDMVDAADHAVLQQAAHELGEYFSGARVDFDVPLGPRGTAFQLAAWSALRTIPFGETVSYGEQAKRLGEPGKARAVGAANGRNPLPIIVPCHRVVGANGHLTGFGGGIETKAWLLDHEREVRTRDA
jgi:methylated-DNA-[protein]-cysteine S-methyltransferase